MKKRIKIILESIALVILLFLVITFLRIGKEIFIQEIAKAVKEYHLYQATPDLLIREIKSPPTEARGQNGQKEIMFRGQPLQY